MTTKQNKDQSDLFGQYHAIDNQIRKKAHFLLPNIKNSVTLSYENIIFILIGFLMSCIIFFSLGVEKGRHDINYARNKARIYRINEGVEKNATPIKGGKNVTASESKNFKLRQKTQDRY